MSTRVLAVTVCLAMCFTVCAASFALAAPGKTTSELSADRADSQETTFGDLVTDALCDKAHATISFVGAMSFKRGSIRPGAVALEDVSSLLQTPDETVATAELTGDQIRQALERSVSRAPLPNGAFLQVSGLSVVYTPGGAPNARIKSILIGAAPLSETQKYEVAMPLSLAKGGSGYFQMFDDGSIRVRGAEPIAKIVADYVAARGTVSYTGQGRIRH
jgi:2',3'-cyclic-nucleotide 2'-phosphodiesterase (5'-nucleotidase family)